MMLSPGEIMRYAAKYNRLDVAELYADDDWMYDIEYRPVVHNDLEP